MKVLLTVVLSVVLGSATLIPAAPQAGDKSAKPKGPEGYWTGRIKFLTTNVLLGVNITRKKSGALAGTLDSPDEGLFNLPMDKVTFKDGALRFDIDLIKAAFEGQLKNDGAELTGKWLQSGLKIPLTFKRGTKALALTRPQDPKKPYPYLEEEVSYENKKAGVKFAGTLTLPKGKGPFPAVLLITGSGPQNRDEELFGHRPFRVLADHLTRRGIAVLRVDDRGVGGSTGKTMESTSADFAEDALAGIAFLKNRKEINPKQIGLAGHSEGGIVGPLAASQSKDVAFVIMLSGTALPGEDILYLQSRLVWQTLGSNEKFLTSLRQGLTLLFRAMKEEKDAKAGEMRFKQLWAEELAKLTEEEKKDAATADKMYLQTILKLLRTPWGRYFLTYDPRPALRKVRCPVLALFGEKDLQVPPRENLPETAKALAEGVCKDYTVRQIPNVNHMFQTCKTGAPNEYGRIQETMTPVVLETISAWILERAKKNETQRHRGTEKTAKEN